MKHYPLHFGGNLDWIRKFRIQERFHLLRLAFLYDLLGVGT